MNYSTKVILLLASLPVALFGQAFSYTAGIECAAFRDCMEALPKGEYAASVVYLADIADYDAMNRVYQAYFPGLKPARNTVQMQLRPGIRMVLQATRFRGPEGLRGLTPPNVTNVVPITPGVIAGDRLFIAGILGRDSNTGAIPDSAIEQVRMCLKRLENVLGTAGLTAKSALQFTAFHTAKIPREVLLAELQQYFGVDNPVAITILEVPALALGAQVGIHGVADAKK